MTTEIISHQIAQSSRSCEISPLELTLEDVGRLDKYFESWDDYDSWLGGWTADIKEYLGVNQSPTLKSQLVTFYEGEKFGTVETDHNIRLLPRSTASMVLYLILTELFDQINNTTRSFLT
ncbi:MAG: hypothetical protein ACFFB3_08445 [Candidatus Hodarchaeota archaeon]